MPQHGICMVRWFGGNGGRRASYPCELVNLERRKAYLWTPTTAARNRPDPWVVEVVCDVRLRDTYQLKDGDIVAFERAARGCTRGGDIEQRRHTERLTQR